MATALAAPYFDEYATYSGTTRWIILAAVMLATLMQVVDTSIVNVAIPTMMGNLGCTLDQISWVSTGYIIANVIVLPLTGWLSSRFGRRQYLAGSIVLFTVASFFCGTAHSLETLVIFRIIQGAGGAALLSTAQATMMEIFPPQQMGMVQSIYGIGIMVGPTIGPTLGGWITDNYSWPWIFYINIPIGIMAAILTMLFMHDSKYEHSGKDRIDVIGIGFLAVGLGCLQTVLEKGNRESWFESPLICWLSVLAAVGIVLFIVWELRSEHPAVNLRVLKNRGLAAGSIFSAVVGFGLYGGVFILPVFLQQLRHYTAQQSGFALLPGALATAFVMPFLGKMVGRFPARNLVAIGALGFVASMYMLRTLTMETGPDQMFWPLVLRGAAMGFLFVPLTIATLTGLRGRDIADGTGLFGLFRQLGGSAGIAVLSTFLDNRASFHRAILVENINVYSTTVMRYLAGMTSMFMAKGAPLAIARQQALSLINMSVQGQAMILSYEDAFLVIGVIFIAAMPLLLLFKKSQDKTPPIPVELGE
jgi:DHA2 family multidrug resistance protein